MKILLVDDEASIERLVSSMITDAGYEFAYTDNGHDALTVAEEEKPDLIIMDVMMPKMDGFTACRELRARGVTAPVIFLSAKGDIVDKGIGFQAGGDDYMVKPFDPRELLMHIEAHLRRASMTTAATAKEEVLRFGRFTLDAAQFRATKEDARISLTPKEFKILFALASNPGVVLSKEQLVEAAWGKEFVGETSSITVFIKKLREKVEDDPSDPRIIQTVWGIGYRLEPEAC
ncbi:response regulator transcription factor [Raoultibacter phocaeensis]|uniref:response regulator transcription factor n=1 Tax=Raoultibacter phocaeensis TaxID=2479841 RepID=UPI00111A5969|nr:response regulator transcription factor [Raoultibacter phocaeensis]